MSTQKTIFISAFQPFAGRGKNGSATILEALKKEFLGENVHFLLLPVVWGIVEQTALPTVESLTPYLALGLGEGRPNMLAIETVGVNGRDGLDENQQAPAVDQIDAEGPAATTARLQFNWDPSKNYPYPVMLSRDAGKYLCNNTLYRYARSGAGRAGFIHLPPQGETPDEEYLAQLLPIVVDIIRQNSAE